MIEDDEINLAKKLSSGHTVEEVLIVGMIERTPERRIIVFKTTIRDSKIMISSIIRDVHPKSFYAQYAEII